MKDSVVEIQATSPLCFISEGTLLQGTVYLKGRAQVHGMIEGKLIGETQEPITIGEKANIQATIEVQGAIWIEGQVVGDVRSQSLVVLGPHACVKGNIETPLLEIHPGAYFQGKTKARVMPLRAVELRPS